MFDVDNFKRLNDTYGHQFGDTVLSTVAHTLRAAVQDERGEFAARYGGEEFICVLYAETAGEAFSRADEVRRAIGALEYGPPYRDFSGNARAWERTGKRSGKGVKTGCGVLFPTDGCP